MCFLLSQVKLRSDKHCMHCLIVMSHQQQKLRWGSGMNSHTLLWSTTRTVRILGGAQALPLADELHFQTNSTNVFGKCAPTLSELKVSFSKLAKERCERWQLKAIQFLFGSKSSSKVQLDWKCKPQIVAAPIVNEWICWEPKEKPITHIELALIQMSHATFSFSSWQLLCHCSDHILVSIWGQF